MIERLARQFGKEERDLLVLKTVIRYHPIEIAQIAERTGIDEYKTRQSIRMLEDDGLVDPTPDGAVPADSIHTRLEEINAGLDRLADRIEGLSDIFSQ